MFNAHAVAVAFTQLAGGYRCRVGPGLVVANHELGIHITIAFGAAVGAVAVALTEAAGEQAQSVFTTGDLRELFPAQAGIFGGGQVNVGVDITGLRIGLYDRPDGAVRVHLSGIIV